MITIISLSLVVRTYDNQVLGVSVEFVVLSTPVLEDSGVRGAVKTRRQKHQLPDSDSEMNA